MPSHLIIYNLAMDLDSTVLASNFDWVEAFAKRFKKVTVFTTQLGRIKDIPNVKIIQVGGKSNVGRLKAVFRLIFGFLMVSMKKEEKYIFYHMSHKPAVILGLLYKFLRCRQVLWYSHSKQTLGLVLATKFVDNIVSTNVETFPLKNPKFVSVGHGIKISKFENSKDSNLESRDSSGFVAIGRVVPIKNIETMIEALQNQNTSLTLIGEISDQQYYQNLKVQALSYGVTLEHIAPVVQESLPQILRQYSFAINCTPKSVDKAILEATICGLIPISENIAVLDSTGMNKYWSEKNMNFPSIKEQVVFLLSLKNYEVEELSSKIKLETIKNNDLDMTISKIVSLLSA
ncbi:MAG: hypothetical protein RLZZ44_1390 [Bacteroidota bacterium]